MIDPAQRNAAIRAHAADPAVAVTPVRRRAGLRRACRSGRRPGAKRCATHAPWRRAQRRTLALIGHVCGTDGDPQDQCRQQETLEARRRDHRREQRRGGVAGAPRSRSQRSARSRVKPLFKDSLTVINVGAGRLRRKRRRRRRPCIALEWQPPAQGDRDGGWALAEILNHPLVEPPNARASRVSSRRSRCSTDVALAREVLPGMAAGRRLIVHAGPPIAWPRCAGRCAARCWAPWCSKAGRIRSSRGSRLVERGGDRARAVPSPCGRRADGRHHQSVDAGIRRRKQVPRAIARTATSTKAWARCCASAPTGRRSSRACA